MQPRWLRYLLRQVSPTIQLGHDSLRRSGWRAKPRVPPPRYVRYYAFRPRVEMLEDRCMLSTFTWTGADSFFNNGWKDKFNWAPGPFGYQAPDPLNHDDLVFPADAQPQGFNNYNDFFIGGSAPGGFFRSITFSKGTGGLRFGGYTLNGLGNPIQLDAGIADSSGLFNSVRLTSFSIAVSQSFSLLAPATDLIIDSPVVLSNGAILTLDNSFSVADYNASGDLGLMNGDVSGNGGLVDTGAGFWGLSGNNSYTGLTSIQGTLSIGNDNALGSTTNGTVVTNGGSLLLRPAFSSGGMITVPEPLALNGAGNSSSPAALDLDNDNTEALYPNLTGTITLGSNTTISARNYNPSLVPDLTISAPLNTKRFHPDGQQRHARDFQRLPSTWS